MEAPGPDLTGCAAPPILRRLASSVESGSPVMRPARPPRATRPAPTGRGIVATSAGALLLGCLPLLACGGGREGRAAPPGVGPNEGAGHPNVGKLAPDFAAQDPSGPWLPLESLRAQPAALPFVRTGSPMAVALILRRVTGTSSS